MARALMLTCAHVTGCRQCGLPAPTGSAFCCYGCELAHRIQADARNDHAALHATVAFTLVLSMIVMMLALFLYAEDVFYPSSAAKDTELAWLRSTYRWASLVLATPVMALAGWPLARRAATQLVKGRLSMDALITLGAFAAFGLSVHALLTGRHGVYFDSAVTALVLATFGRALEATARSKASGALGPLLEVSRSTVKRRMDDGAMVSISAAEIEPGMKLEIEPGRVVPVDLQLDIEAADVDLAVITGESRPVHRVRGEVVVAGAVPVEPAIPGTALRASRDSALERLASLAKSLGEGRTRTLAWADRFAAALTPIVAAVAVVTVVAWTRHGSFATGVVAGLAVVLAACPCSYAIASPLVHWSVMRRAFHHGVLVRSPEAIEELARTRAVAFDKTGTLTRPELSIEREEIAPTIDRAEVLSLVRALEEGLSHPIARALVAHAGSGASARIEERRVVSGRGVFARDVDGRGLSLHADDRGGVVLERDDEVMARFFYDETLRPEARETVDALRDAGLRVVSLSGDSDARAKRVGDALGIEAFGGLLPEAKLASLRALGPHTAIVGDGVNDAPALAAHRTSFTFGDAAQLAKGVAQITLLDTDLRLVPWTIDLARKGVRRVKVLLMLSTAYNVAFVALAATGNLRPVWAGLSMLVSSLVAVAFAVRLGGEERGDDGRSIAGSGRDSREQAPVERAEREGAAAVEEGAGATPW